jgi:hypothetical protein
VNVKESENHNMTKGDTSYGDYNGSRGKANFSKGDNINNNQGG